MHDHTEDAPRGRVPPSSVVEGAPAQPAAPEDPALAGALSMAEAGFRVYPQYGIAGGHCTCVGAGGQCRARHPGKHPAVSGWQTAAATNAETIRTWFAEDPRRNYAVLAGNGIAVLDIDPRNGGDATLAALEKDHGELPHTLRVRTGGGGLHYYFEARTAIRSCVLGPGVEVKGEGSGVTGPGSLHSSGRRYEIEDSYKLLAPLPSWIYKAAKMRSAAVPPADGDGAPLALGDRHRHLLSLAGSMRAKGAAPEAIRSALLVEAGRARPPQEAADVEEIVRSSAGWPAGAPAPEAGPGKKPPKPKEPKTEYRALLPGLVDLVEGADGEIGFLLLAKDGALRFETEIRDIERKITILPFPREHVPGEVVRLADVQAALKEDDATLSKDLVSLLPQGAEVEPMPGLGVYGFLGLWIMHTWCLEGARYTPFLGFVGPPERGKSRLGRLLMALAWRGFTTPSPREANVFRIADRFAASIFLDLRDAWRKIEDCGLDDVLLVRFENGAKIPRVNLDARPPNDLRLYNVFGPTVIASNASLEPVLGTRVIEIGFPLSRQGMWPDLVPETLRALKGRLAAFRARHLRDRVFEVEKPAAGRLGDILKPLRGILALVAPDRDGDFLALAAWLGDGRRRERAESLDGRIVAAWLELAGERFGADRIPAADVAERVDPDVPQEKLRGFTMSTGRRLRALGFKPDGRHGAARAYLRDPDLEARLGVHYGAAAAPAEEAEDAPF